VRKSPTARAGRGPVSDGGAEVREATALMRKDSGTALRLGSDLLLLVGSEDSAEGKGGEKSIDIEIVKNTGTGEPRAYVPKSTHCYCHLVLCTLWKAPIVVRTRESGPEIGREGNEGRATW